MIPEINTRVTLRVKITVFRDVMSCSYVEGHNISEEVAVSIFSVQGWGSSQNFTPKRRYISIKLHGALSQKN